MLNVERLKEKAPVEVCVCACVCVCVCVRERERERERAKKDSMCMILPGQQTAAGPTELSINTHH